ncbi:hypothetical protein [Dyadobacter sandarakinus]|uniref:MG2 domain-containing protein n=1 Tax=Dyadobacter sandarakinus TaxID=2747268 RepID=A0ABX7I8H7_9BACT|nr:hypothetical protein [Dyadobacter sandarakinus]QRR02255.1 hypothetical protein HWI92_15765 [Dyadobacter sandarakinus]
MKTRTFISIVVFFASLPLFVTAQEDAMIRSIRQRFDLFREKSVQEKMYVHLDRTLYLIGETIWFKAYNLDGNTHLPLDLSKVGYLEVLDQDNNAVAQTKFSIAAGKGNGTLLIPAGVISGSYKVRCYTSWMKNAGPDYFFETPVTIVNPFVRFDPGTEEVADEGYDVQFFPEGGHLVQGIESKVAFRAIGPDGKGLTFQGALVNSRNDTVARFTPERSGIGFFVFTPEKDEQYKAAVRNKRGQWSAYEFPAAEMVGYVMRLREGQGTMMDVVVSGKREDEDEPSTVYLLSHTRQGNVLADKKVWRKGSVTFQIDKSQLGEGISQITVFNEKLRPICERLYFKRPTQRLQVSATSSKNYITREKVSLELTAALGNAPAPLTDLSISIFREDSIQARPQQDISSYFWLSSDLKGTVEDPGYYFENPSSEKDRQLDNLMLTHGWRRFKWEQVFSNKPLAFDYLPEYDGHFIFAKLLNKNDSTPAKGVEAFLASLDVPARLYVAHSDPKGNLMFEVRKFTGPKEITLQTNLSRDSLYRFEFTSPFPRQFSDRKVPPFVFDKTMENQLLTRAINMQTSNAFMPVKYVDRNSTLTDSLPFFGMPDEKYFLDDYTRFPTMEEVLREYVKGVLVRRRQKQWHFWMVDKLIPNTLYNTDPLILLDGIPVFNAGKIIEFDPLKVKKIELISSRYFLGLSTFTGIVSFSTYQGNLGGFELDPRVTVMPYDGIQAEREFYAPRYDSANAGSRIPDFRNLLYWSPGVTTGADGKAHVDFYTSDQDGHYRVVVQGMNPAGVSGSHTFTFDVNRRNF